MWGQLCRRWLLSAKQWTACCIICVGWRRKTKEKKETKRAKQNLYVLIDESGVNVTHKVRGGATESSESIPLQSEMRFRVRLPHNRGPFLLRLCTLGIVAIGSDNREGVCRISTALNRPNVYRSVWLPSSSHPNIDSLPYLILPCYTKKIFFSYSFSRSLEMRDQKWTRGPVTAKNELQCCLIQCQISAGHGHLIVRGSGVPEEPAVPRVFTRSKRCQRWLCTSQQGHYLYRHKSNLAFSMV